MLNLSSRVRAPQLAAEEAEAVPGRCPSPGSRRHPGRSELPAVQAAVAAEAAAVAGEAAEPIHHQTRTGRLPNSARILVIRTSRYSRGAYEPCGSSP